MKARRQTRMYVLDIRIQNSAYIQKRYTTDILYNFKCLNYCHKSVPQTEAQASCYLLQLSHNSKEWPKQIL